MNSILRKSFVSVILFLSLSVLTVIAGVNHEGYNTTVGKFGDYGYTANQTKKIAGANGYLKSHHVGGNYTVRARMRNKYGVGPWTGRIGDGTFVTLGSHIQHTSGTTVNVQLQNSWNTPVSVQVSGTWASN